MLLPEPKVHAIGAQSALSLALGRRTEKEWPREMRKQIEFSKTIARARARDTIVVVVVAGGDGGGSTSGVGEGTGIGDGGGGGGGGGGARYLQVRGRFTSGGQAGTDRAEGRWRGYERKIKEGAGGKLERVDGGEGEERRRRVQINCDDNDDEGRWERMIARDSCP